MQGSRMRISNAKAVNYGERFVSEVPDSVTEQITTVTRTRILMASGCRARWMRVTVRACSARPPCSGLSCPAPG